METTVRVKVLGAADMKVRYDTSTIDEDATAVVSPTIVVEPK